MPATSLSTTGDFDAFYSDNPVGVLDKNQRIWYDPDIMFLFQTRSLFSGLINYTRNLADPRAAEMVVTQVFGPHPNYNAISARQLWMPAMHIDSREIHITFNHYGGKVALSEYDFA